MIKNMENFFIEIIIGVIVAALATWFGLSGSKTSVVIKEGVQVKKTGKKIIIVSIIMILGGFILIGNSLDQNNEVDYENIKFWMGVSFAGYGVLFYFLGKIVAWYQRP